MVKRVLLIILGIGAAFLAFLVVREFALADDNYVFVKVKSLTQQADWTFEEIPHAMLLLQDQKLLDKGMSAGEAKKAHERMRVEQGFLAAMGPDCRDISNLDTKAALAFLVARNSGLIKSMQDELKEVEAHAPHQSMFSKDSYPDAKTILVVDTARLGEINSQLIKKR